MADAIEFETTMIIDGIDRVDTTVRVETKEHFRAGPTVRVFVDGREVVELYARDAIKMARGILALSEGGGNV